MSVTARPVLESRPSPPALRSRRPGWRDPRLAVGLVLVFGSVLAGARVLADADDTVSVLAARGALAAGTVVEADDLTTVRLRFASEADADRYLPGGDRLPEGAVLLRPVGPGEVVPRAAVGAADAEALAELPLAVDPAHVPDGLRAGATVDVWVAGAGSGAGPASERLLSAVPVLAAPRGTSTGPSGLRQVVVGVPASDEPGVARVVARVGADAPLVLVRRPSGWAR